MLQKNWIWNFDAECKWSGWQFFMANGAHRWDSLPKEWSRKHSQLLHLRTGTATWNLWSCARSLKVNMCCGIMNNCVIGNFFPFPPSSPPPKKKHYYGVHLHVYVRVVSFSTNWWLSNREKKVKFCFNKTVLHSSAGVRYVMLGMSDFLVSGLTPMKFRSLDTGYFFVGIYKLSLLPRENLKLKSSATEN